jgi:Na+-transporting NADH:ubiquinone oxidoreductase subunit NqrB
MPAMDVTVSNPESSSGQLGVLRCTLTGALVLPLLVALCWVAAATNLFPASHMFISLFTNLSPASPAAFAASLSWSVVFGGIAGGMTAFIYNASGVLAR